ncbi:Negative elongation factor E [Holothuria leucospilota]|uniref:Negative elongation factor E n=1 Tax=Holothuria leucospilota TaxID=206669 RepID=A0A9Q0YN75_HOLLE|nr:Negative elongation factor E [Holothuria leucospilota]
MTFPNKLTEEEEMLVEKYSLLRKKRKALQQIKKSSKPAAPPPTQQPVKRSADTNQEEAKEMAKKVMAAQALRHDNKGSGFKRSTNLERRLQNPDKAPAFHPFSQAPPPSVPSSSADENSSTNTEEKKPIQKSLYDNFVSGGFRSQQTLYDDNKRDKPGGNSEKKRGNTLYVSGHGLNKELCEKAFKSFGKIKNISVEPYKPCAFVTFESINSAEAAIEVNGNMVDNVTLKVSMARRQPRLEEATDMNSPWTGLATGLTRGRHKDQRKVLSYEDDIF